MRTRKTVVILISGKAGAGKSTVSKLLYNKILDIPEIVVKQYSFADPIKYIATAFIGWDGNKDELGRKLLQDLGKVGRAYDENIWVTHCLNQMGKGIFPPNFVIVDDWRFPNEAEYLKKNPLIDVVTVRIYGRGGLNGETANDVSEISLPEIGENHNWENETLYNYGTSNTGDLEQLDGNVDLLLHEISKQYIVE